MPDENRSIYDRLSVERQESAALQAVDGAGPFAGGSRGTPEPALSADLLATFVERRLRWLPACAGRSRDSRVARPGPAPRGHERGATGGSWDVSGFA
jgi:hypothetical protein